MSAPAPDHDPERTYSPEETARLTVHLRELTQEVFGRECQDLPCTPHIVQGWHARFFHGVRDHGGRMRGPDNGQEHLRFGPNRSIHRAYVPTELEQLFVRVRESIGTFDASPDDVEYENRAVRLAVWAHAEFIRIHPFEDGNGRIGRLWMSWILVRLGLTPLRIEAPKSEYLACLNKYFERKNLQPLIDLFLRVYLDNARSGSTLVRNGPESE